MGKAGLFLGPEMARTDLADNSIDRKALRGAVCDASALLAREAPPRHREVDDTTEGTRRRDDTIGPHNAMGGPTGGPEHHCQRNARCVQNHAAACVFFGSWVERAEDGLI